MKKHKLGEFLFEVYVKKGETVDYYEWAMKARFPKKDRVEFDCDDDFEDDRDFKTAYEEMKQLSPTEEHLWTDLMKKVRQ